MLALTGGLALGTRRAPAGGTSPPSGPRGSWGPFSALAESRRLAIVERTGSKPFCSSVGNLVFFPHSALSPSPCSVAGFAKGFDASRVEEGGTEELLWRGARGEEEPSGRRESPSWAVTFRGGAGRAGLAALTARTFSVHGRA